MPTEPLWKISNVRYFSGVVDWPVAPVTLDIPRGRTAILGPSGAGKTSLIEVLVGFKRPMSGESHVPSSLAWVPQDHGLWPAHTTREHLTLVGANTTKAEQLLAAFDLAEVGTSRAGDLSLGEGARLSVARALAQNAPVLVMDEPLAHVDSARVGKYWRVIREHIASTGASLVFATHQPETALAEAEHAICLHAGSPVFQGSIPQLYNEPPDEELARCLGPANWLTPDNARAWLGESLASARCVRPERLVIAQDGPLTVVASRFSGAFAETELRSADGATRTFLHRPEQALAVDTKVKITVKLFATT